MTRLKAEMEAPPPYKKAPQPETVSSGVLRRKQEFDGNGAPLRREVASGIPGLTYDQAGRPVWRDPNLDWSKTTIVHDEGRR